MMHPWRMVRWSSLARAGIVGLTLLLGGCSDGDEAEVSVPAARTDLGGPWQAQPFAVAPEVIEAALGVCRDPPVAPVRPGTELVVVDARGANRLTLLFVGPLDASQCFLTREPNGRLAVAGGEGEGNSEGWPALGPVEVMSNGVGSEEGSADPNDESVSTSHLIGRAGPAIAAVDVVVPSGLTVRASLNRGWFSAWWLGLDHEAVVVLRGYDAGGNLVGTSR